MNELACTKEQFLENVKDHKIEIIKDDGVYRHIVMSKGSFEMKYSVVTFPQHLCFSGDMGTYVFNRVDDMFTFFRKDDGAINPGYWAEKLESIDRNGGFEQFDEELFREAVKEQFDSFVEYSDREPEEYNDIWKEVESEVFSKLEDGKEFAFVAISSFNYDGFDFMDFFETKIDSFTFRFIWCLRAIVYAIQKYDEAKK